jgi:glycosyltransferase involved in cell wall biosynthesis
MHCSIIINNYNYGRFLKKAIDSALRQTYSNCEVVVVDDGSTDDSISVIESYGTCIVPVLKANGGQGSAMNAGFLSSGGQVIIYLDADDTLEANAVEEVMKAWRPGVCHVYYRLMMRDEGNNSLGEFQLGYEGFDVGEESWRPVLERGGLNFPPTTGNAFSREALTAILPMPEDIYRICSDVYLFLNTPFLGEVIRLDSFLGNYLVHGNNHWFKTPNEPGKTRLLGLNRRNAQQYQKRLPRLVDMYERMDAGRREKFAEWGEEALQRWIRLRWRQLLSLKCLAETHPFSGDNVTALSQDILAWSSQIGAASLGLRLRLLLVRLLPGSVLSVFLFKK